MKTIFLLGAGFTFDISEGQFPLIDRDINAGIVPFIGQDIVNRYSFGQDYFEAALTRLDLDCESNLDNISIEFKDSLLKARKLIYEKIAEIFSWQGKQVKINHTAETFVNKILRKDDIVLTTNYDSYLDNLLGPEKWSPHGGYGSRMNWATGSDENSKRLNIKIFKLHGSLAFRKIWSEYAQLGSVELAISRSELPAFHSELGYLDDVGSYLILPSYIKPFEFSSMMELYREAIEEIRTGSRLIIIGSSLRKEDYILWFILSYFSFKNKVIIVSPNADAIKNSLKKTFLLNNDNIEILDGKLTMNIDKLQTMI